LFRRSLRKQKKQAEKIHSSNSNSQQSSGQKEDFSVQLFTSVKDNIENIRRMLNSPHDLVTREFSVGNSSHRCALVYIDGMIDKNIINGTLLKNIQINIAEANKQVPESGQQLLDKLFYEVISNGELKKSNTLDDVMLDVLSGDTAVFVEGTSEVLIIGSKGWNERAVEEPSTEGSVRGPRDGFTENIRTNTAHLRRRLRDPNLRLDAYKIGRRSKKDVIVTYIDGIAHPDLVQEVKRRLQGIDIDDAPDSAYIEQWIEDSFMSPFPLIDNTERPDKVSAAITQGKVAILLDGTPFALVMPTTMASAMHAQEDFYERSTISTLIRIIRYISAFIAVFLPGLYVALIEYHQGMIPSKLAFSIAGSREGVPFPAIVEVLMMEVTMEILREAGLRLPKPIGQTIGIVGGLVIGEAAVAAGIVSPIMVIVVAITAVANFAMPSYNFGISLRILRFFVIFAASLFGFFGLVLAYIMINIHVANLKSFGIPYSTPFAPTFFNDWKDLILRAPLTMVDKRPQMLQSKDKVRTDRRGRQ
jgi:spore germination protein